MKREFIPADAAIAELEKKAADCEERAEMEQEPAASALREEAKQYRGLIAGLRARLWTS